MVEKWFGSDYALLHPTLQQLHRTGGVLQGVVEIYTPTGLAGIIGRRVAKKLGVPTQKTHQPLLVEIYHCKDGLHWNRTFGSKFKMQSLFQPIGNRQNGYWLEQTGPIKMKLTVDIIDRGWSWRCLTMAWGGLRLPLWLFPRSKAYKTITNDGYQFFVGFSLPFIGNILSYSGTLKPSVN